MLCLERLLPYTLRLLPSPALLRIYMPPSRHGQYIVLQRPPSSPQRPGGLRQLGTCSKRFELPKDCCCDNALSNVEAVNVTHDTIRYITCLCVMNLGIASWAGGISELLINASRRAWPAWLICAPGCAHFFFAEVAHAATYSQSYTVNEVLGVVRSDFCDFGLFVWSTTVERARTLATSMLSIIPFHLGAVSGTGVRHTSCIPHPTFAEYLIPVHNWEYYWVYHRKKTKAQ